MFTHMGAAAPGKVTAIDKPLDLAGRAAHHQGTAQDRVFNSRMHRRDARTG